LGLFVTWQLGFLLASNLVAFFPHGEPEQGELSDSRSGPAQAGGSGPAQCALEVVGGLTDRWAHLTGQMQAWWLFAPSVPSQATFPVVELRWDDPDGPVQNSIVAHPPVRLQTVLEPSDTHAYFRPPGSFDRLFHYEIRLGLIFTAWDESLRQRFPWSSLVEERVRRQWRSMRAYLRWRVHQFEREHPDLPSPRQAVLLVHIYRTPRPSDDPRSRPAVVEKALARWRPGTETVGRLPVEMCDPVTDSYLSLASTN
jgi:hypothetical protein